MMVAMAPGKDGTEWFLCPRCFQDGLTKMNGEPIAPIAEPPKAAARGSSRASSKREPERSAAKDDVGSFDPRPNEPESEFTFTGGTGTFVPDGDGYW